MRHGGSYVIDKPGARPRLVAFTRNQAEAGDPALEAATVAEREAAADAAIKREKKAAGGKAAAGAKAETARPADKKAEPEAAAPQNGSKGK